MTRGPALLRHLRLRPPHPQGNAGSEWCRFAELLRGDFARTRNLDERVTLLIWRSGQCLHERPGLGAFVLRRLYHFADAIWIRGLMGAALPQQVRVGPGLRLPHAGRGLILHHTARLGANVTVYHQVTIGVKDDRGAASIGDNSEIGAGARIIGPIEVGDDCRVGANAVVVKDVPHRHTAVGVPAVNRPHA